MLKKIKSSSGISIVELLLALFLTGVITTAMFRVYSTQHKNWMIQDSVVEMQQNARAALDELARQLRMAGFGLPNCVVPMDTGYNGHDSSSDSIAIYYRTDTCNAMLHVGMTSTSNFPLDLTGTSVACFHATQEVYIYNPNLDAGEFFIIQTVDPASVAITPTAALTRTYPVGSVVMAIDRIMFQIDRSDADHPMLTMRLGTALALATHNDRYLPQPYASDVDDIQFTYTSKTGVTVDSPILPRDVRQIGIVLRARTANADSDFDEAHQYRYETYQSQVFLRNLSN